MSDLSTAAAALGIPEVLVERSAQARAAETGASVEEIIAAWAGGAPLESSPAASAEPAVPASEPTPSESDPAGTSPVVTAPEVEAAPLPAEVTSPAQAVAAGPYRPPVLVGASDDPTKVLAGVVGLFVIVLLVGLVGPSLRADNPGARTSQIALSTTAVAGQKLYIESGCVACHTQMVRPVVADVGLGAVTLNDTNQILGTRRFGPDLSNVGNRLDQGTLEGIVRGDVGGHPAHNLSDGDMSALVAYLAESRTES